MALDRLELRTAPHSVRWFEGGEHCTDPVPGDVLLVDHTTIVAKAITFGERLLTISEPDLRGFTWCDHAALICDVGSVPMVSEMGPRGHERRPLSTYLDRRYAIVHFEIDDVARAAILSNDDACAHVGYGWFQYVPLVLDGLSGAHVCASYGSTMICSTHVTMCIMGPALFPDRQPGGVAPCHLARYFGARHD